MKVKICDINPIAREKLPQLAEQISLSLHCETAEIMTAYTAIAEKNRKRFAPARS